MFDYLSFLFFNGVMNQEWEISKENVMPIKEGRSVDSLNQALQLGTPQRNKSIESKIQYLYYCDVLFFQRTGEDY